jgi:hypothetical protein
MAKDKSKSKKAEPVVEEKVKKGKKAAPVEEPKKAKKAKDEAPAKGGKTKKGSLGGPGSTAQFSAEEWTDHLLLITPKSIEHDIVTSNGTADATRADIVVLDTNPPKLIDNALIFQKVVQGQLREAVESKGRVVGTLFVDTASKKAGQSAPYRIAAPSKKDLAKGQAYLDKLDPLR